LVFDAINKALSGLDSALHAGIGEFAAHEKASAQTAAALKSTGSAAQVTQKQIESLALRLDNLSGVNHNVVQSGENVLLSFTRIRDQVGKGNDVFTRATKDALDWAQRTGKDLPTAARLLGAALENPERKAGALARAGIVLTASQLKLIKSLQDSGHALEAQKLILGEVEKRFGGAAKAAGETLSGQLNILKNRFSDLAASVVGEFQPGISKAIKSLTAWFQSTQNQAKVQHVLKTAFNDLRSAVEVTVGVFRKLVAEGKTVVDALGGVKNTLKALAAVAFAVKVSAWIQSLLLLGTKAAASTGKITALRAAMLRLGAIGVIAIGVELLINKGSVDKAVTKFLRGHHLGFLTGQQITLPVNMNLAAVTKMRDAIAKLKGDNDLFVKVLDKLIAKAKTGVAGIQKRIDELHGKVIDLHVTGSAAAIAEAAALEKKIAALKSRKLKVELGSPDARAIQAQIDRLKGRIVSLGVVGTPEAIRKVARLQLQIDALKDKKVQVQLGQTGAQARDIQKQIDSLKGKIVKLGLVGGPETIRQVAAIQEQIDSLHGKKVQIELQDKRKTADIQREIDGLHGKILQLELLGTPKAIAEAAALQKQIDSLKGKQVAIQLHDGHQAAAIQARIDKLKGKIVTLGVSGSATAIAQTQALQKQIDALEGKKVIISVSTDVSAKKEAPVNQGMLAIARDAARKGALATKAQVDEALGLADTTGNAKAAAAAALKAAKAAAAAAAKAWQTTFDKLSLNVSRATLTPSFKDDLAANESLIVALERQIKLHKDDLGLQNQLVSAQQTRLSLVQQQKDAELAARNATQFRSLGLDATGQALAPTKKGLAAELARVTAGISGTLLDTSKTRSVLAAIRKLVLDPFTKVSAEVRNTIKAMLDNIDQQLTAHGSGGKAAKVIDAKKVLANLGLSPDQLQAATPRLVDLRGGTASFDKGSGLNTGVRAGALAGAGAGITINGPITVVASNPDEFTKGLQRKARRTTAQTRGVRGGNSLGIVG
jgi:peptide deformylase